MWKKISLIVIMACCLERVWSQGEVKCTSNDDCEKEFGENSFFECSVRKVCECSDFFVLDPTNSSTCLKGASFNQTCDSDIQCSFILGPSGVCNSTLKKCDCVGKKDEEIVHFDRRCYSLKKLGETCSENLECMLDRNGNQSSNALGRCLKGTCACLVDDMTSSWNSDGKCITCEHCTRVEISLFAIMSSGTVVLILFVYIMYRVGSHKKNK